MQVFVRDNNVDQALRVLKTKAQREGMIADPRKKKLLAARAGARPAGRPGAPGFEAPGSGALGGDVRRPPQRRV